MKKILFVLCAMFIVMTMVSAPNLMAQVKTDSVGVINAGYTPVFTGSEKNLADSLISIGHAVTDSETRSVITDAVAVIKSVPKKGGVEEWYGYIVGVLGALFGIYQFAKKRSGAAPISNR